MNENAPASSIPGDTLITPEEFRILKEVDIRLNTLLEVLDTEDTEIHTSRVEPIIAKVRGKLAATLDSIRARARQCDFSQYPRPVD